MGRRIERLPAAVVHATRDAPQSPGVLRTLTATAQRIARSVRPTAGTIGGSTFGKVADWQALAWDLYDLVGEFSYVVDAIASRAGRARLYVGTRNAYEEEPVPLETDDAHAEALTDLFGSAERLGELVTRLATNLGVAGEGWLVEVPTYLTDPDAEDDGETAWHMLSVTEVRLADGVSDRIALDMPDLENSRIEVDPEELGLVRVWRPHPRRYSEATAATRSALPVVTELVNLTKHVTAQVESRLAGAGVLVVSDAIQRSLRQQALPDGQPFEDDGVDVFTDALIEAMVTPIGDRDSASAVVPLVVTVPDEAVDKIKHLTFSTPLDAETRELREEAIRRLALSMDAPPELLLGTSGMNHWGGWLVKEETVESHVVPPLRLICGALTTQILHPYLLERGVPEDEVDRYVVGFDVGHLVARPNAAADALALYQAGVLSQEALLGAYGYAASDAPAAEDSVEPAVVQALDLVASAPTLAADPGIPALVETLRAVMGGDSAPPVAGPEPNDAPAPGGPPQSIGDAPLDDPVGDAP